MSTSPTPLNAAQRIADMTAQEDVFPGFTPVLLYRFDPQTGSAGFAGTGSMFADENGLQVITSAHIFSERLAEMLISTPRAPESSTPSSSGQHAACSAAMRARSMLAKTAEAGSMRALRSMEG
jgi:hypothetical protein